MDSKIILEWSQCDKKYIDGDIVKIGHMGFSLMFGRHFVRTDDMSFHRLAIFRYNKCLCDKHSMPWNIYEPKRKDIVRYLHDEFTNEFGTVFGYVTEHEFGWNHYVDSGDISDNYWTPDDESIKKEYIVRDNNGFLIINEPNKFMEDLDKLRSSMTEEFNRRGYELFDLKRLNWFVLPPVKIVDAYRRITGYDGEIY